MRQVVVKIQSRCNLACDYCYVYESVDQSWRSQPVAMSVGTVEQLGRRIGEHASRYHLPALQVVLHGGEPLLVGHDVVERALATLRAAAPPYTKVNFSVQTNGTLLDEGFVDIFRRYEVRVGVSLDGDAAATDRHRVHANGRGSYDSITTGLRLLTEYPEIYGGLLCTIDVRNDPVGVYEALTAFRPPMVDLLLPHGNWTNPPPRPDGAMSYAEWLIRIFDVWYDEPAERTRIRLFESIIRRLLGGTTMTEAIGGEIPGIVTIETDGSYEQSDALKTTVEGGPATGLHIDSQSFDDVLEYLAIEAPVELSATCRDCRLVTVCGGGLRAHRFRADNGFDNPSAYCADLMPLIDHIESRVRRTLVAV